MRGSFGDRPGAAAGPPGHSAPGAVAASVFAGLLGAGAADGALVLARESGTSAWPLTALALGIYGAVG